MFDFVIGQKLRCITDSGWYNAVTDADLAGPAYGEVVTIRCFGCAYNDGDFIPTAWFDEYPGMSNDDSFILDNEGFEVVVE